MQFSTLAIAAALNIGSAVAVNTVKIHVVTVGSTTGALTFSPNNLIAAVGDMVQFQFMPKNHSVVQSPFDYPCQPISSFSNTTGIYSGFMPVSASATSIPIYTILINATTPMWLYCSQSKHCQNGMVMVINENTSKNATRSLANYAALAKKVTASISPAGGATNGTDSSTAVSSASASAGSDASATPTIAATSTTTSNGTVKSTSGAMAIHASEALGFTGLLAGTLALILQF